MNSMFFSILVPVYKTEKYLRECLESILRQTFTDYEIILLVDGSTDSCDMICDEYAVQYSSIRVVHKQNEGLMMTRRRGFKEADGEYFICLDSDDYLYDCTALDKIHDLIVSEKCDLVLYDYIHGAEEKKNDRWIKLFDYSSGYVFENKQKIYERLLTSNQMNNIWLKCPHRSIVDIDIDYSIWKKEICRAEDLFQSYPIVTNAKRVGYIAQPLYYYRWASDSISNKCKIDYYYAFRRIYLREDAYLNQWHIRKEIEDKAMCNRITGICTVIVNCYYKCKEKGSFNEWEKFLLEISEDDFFIHILDWCSKNDIFIYYRILYGLIIAKKPKKVAAVIEAVSFISKLKQKCINSLVRK